MEPWAAMKAYTVDVTGPQCRGDVPASTHENRVSELMLEHMTQQGVTGRLEPVLVDRGVTALAACTVGDATTSRSAGSGGTTSSRSSGRSGMPGASR